MSDAKASPSHPAWWVPSRYFAEGLPFFAVSLIAGLLYKRRGVANDVIALYTSWLLLPWSLKPLWIDGGHEGCRCSILLVPLDKKTFGRGRRR